MRTSTLLTSALSVALAALSLTAMAQDSRYPATGTGSRYNAAPQRTRLGLPLPQQWSGVQPTGLTGRNNRQSYVFGGYPANCPNGQCQTGNCANGQCSTGACANGQCSAGACVNGQCSAGRCPNGNCGPAPYTNNSYPQGVRSGWSQGNSRATPADPFRRSGQLSDADAWTPRSGLNSLNDAFSSQYRRNDFDLRSEYFGSDSRNQNELRAPVPTRSRVNSDEWTPSSRRSMEAPAETFSGVARF